MNERAKSSAWTQDLLRAPHAAPDKASRVRRMFNAIAPRYELVNRLFSAGRDAAWRREAVRRAQATPQDEVLDVACGTGDLTRAFARAGVRQVVGCDFAHEMLVRALGRGTGHLSWCEADALCLPFADQSFTIASCAFGVRNWQDLFGGMLEFHRVLRPGGRVVILEFSRPDNGVLRRLFEFYSHRIMPVGAALVARDRSGAYRYLPRSVVSFLTVAEMIETLHRAGFVDCQAVSLSLGVAQVYLGRRR